VSTQYELDFAADTEFNDSEYRESPADATRELQLVLNPEFLEHGAKSPVPFFKCELRTGSRCAPKGHFKSSDNRVVRDFRTIEAKFAARIRGARGIKSPSVVQAEKQSLVSGGLLRMISPVSDTFK
jgi:hypothetical protein